MVPQRAARPAEFASPEPFMRRTLLLATIAAAALLTAGAAGGSMAQTPLLGFSSGRRGQGARH